MQGFMAFIYPTANTKDLFIYNTGTAKLSIDGSNNLTQTGLTNSTIYVNGQVSAALTLNAWNFIMVTHDAITAANWNFGASSFTGNAAAIRSFNAKPSSLEIAQFFHEFARKLGGGSDFGMAIPAPEQHWPMLPSAPAAEVVSGVLGTTNASALSSDRFGIAKGLSFSAQKLEASITTASGNYTLSWYGSLTAPAADSSYYRVFDSQNNGSPTQGAPLALINNGSGVRIASYHQNGSWVTISNDLTSYLGSAHHWAYVFNGSNVYVYVDGALIGSAAQATNYTGFTGTCRWMEKTTASGANLNGSLQEAFRFGVALSADQASLLSKICSKSYPYNFRRSILQRVTKDASTKFLIVNGVDISGNGNNPTYVGSPVAGLAGQNDVKSYDGSTQYGYVTDTSANFVAGLSAMTAACWFRSTNSGSMMIYAHWEWGPWLIKKNASNQLEVLVRTGGVNTTVTTSVVITDGKWHHLGLVYDGANIYVYLDGYLVQSAAKTGSLTYSTAGSPAYVMFASNRQTGPTFTEKLNGSVDGQFLSTRAYSSAEMRGLMYGTFR
jgi:hypothetical protein